MSKKTKKEEVKVENEKVENQQEVISEEAEKDIQEEPKAEDKEEEQPEVDKVAEITSQYEEMKDKYLRLTAEFDNYRKRTLKEKSDILKYAAEEVLKDLLPVIDDLDRALKAVDAAKDIDSVKEGIGLIINKFNDFLKAKGVKEIDALGKELDTDLHEAITKIPVEEEDKKGKIVDVVQKGYMLHDKVMRFSKVVVGE
ncbi:MAG: molecular chaperone GrpE [Tenuifilum sp.]|jgi:molecular chaperone GrpE|uniref:nucleotide exchange factor GrpE n=1 Tax=Tenuifilum sp. TaxID=2760880 RepID=UPI0024AC5368|nr:nucleotide exchange factor GrpE [Tenuifilum sp.]MDI3526538.1 molecular chaperone GrpE [Tenuifilum sp.]